MKKKRKTAAPNRETNQQKQQQYWRVVNSSVLNCAQDLSGIPDVCPGSTGDDVSLDGVSEEGGGDKEGLLAYFKTVSDCSVSSARHLCFCYQLTDNLMVKWDTVLLDRRLYIQVPDEAFMQGSRDSMVALLDAAEEEYECERVIVCFKRKRLDKDQLMKTFRFMGFTNVKPGHAHIPVTDEYSFMVCELD